MAQRIIVVSLALGLLLIYSGTFYAFPALLPALELATGWDKSTLALGPTLSWLAMACLTPLTGRVVDRGKGGTMLMVLPAVAGLGMVALAFAPNPWVWYLGWIAMGVAQAGCVYESVFAILTRRMGADARGAIAQITILAGLAGTLTFPLGHWLGATFGGQRAFLGFAAMTLLGTLPLYMLAVRMMRQTKVAVAPSDEGKAALRAALRRPAFWVIATIFALMWLDHGMLLTFILPLFHERGASAATATFAAACIGPAQLTGRLFLMLGGRRLGNRRATRGALLVVLAASLVLYAAGAAPMLIFAVVLMQGSGMGLMSIMRPMLIVEVLGPKGFGAVSGVAAIAPILATGFAPSLGAWIMGRYGAGGIYAALIVCACLSLILAFGLTRRSVSAPG